MSIDAIWYNNNPLSLLLSPLSWLYCGVASLRRRAYQQGWLYVPDIPVPVIVVGNISVGGTGKTPLVIWLAKWLQQQGYKPGVVSRGYGGKAKSWPQIVKVNSNPLRVGDESVLLARRCHCPVVVAPRRIAAANTLLDEFDCDIIISDDGLQHYPLKRDIEISLVDDIRRYGNRRCLPAGPLRESLTRLQSVDFRVAKGTAMEGEFSMQYQIEPLRSLRQVRNTLNIESLRGETVHAIAGIGHPPRFFMRLKDLGLKVIEHPFPDHHPYQREEIFFNDDYRVLMTEKDAVKCLGFADERHWSVPIEATLPHNFATLLQQRINKLAAAYFTQ